MVPRPFLPRPRGRGLAALLLGAALLPGAWPAGTAAAAAGASAAASAASAASEPVRAQQAWIRWLPANLPAGGYITLTNLSDRAVALVSASSPDYAGVAVHRTLIRDGNASMVPVARIDLAPHATLSFESLGYHLMLMQPRVPVGPGDHVPVTLHFADGRSLTVSFEVRKPAAGAPDAKGTAKMPGMANMPGMSH